VGTLGVAFALVCAAVVLPGARQAQSPILYVVVIGGACVGLPLALAIGCLTGHVPIRGGRNPKR
jgi:hypothetical protein